MIRCIYYSNDSGSREGVYFTDDFDTPAEDFVPVGCDLVNDFTIDADLPSEFPIYTNLEKRN